MILELLPGFWINIKIYPTFYEKSVENSTLKPQIEKGLCFVFVQIFTGKKSKFESR